MTTSKIFNVAVVGTGAIGNDHIHSFQQHPQAQVVAIAETSSERGRAAAAKYSVPEHVTD